MPASVKTRTPLFGTSRISQLPFEFVVALLAAGGMVFVSRFVRSVANPSFEQDIRAGHVSALAAMQIPFFLVVSLSLLIVLAAPRIPKFRKMALSFSPALLAGATTGFIAGSINIALAGTNWPLFGNIGDSGVIINWVTDFRNGNPLPETYPPGYLWLIAGISKILHAPIEFSAKFAQILTIAISGPIAYVAWRIAVGPFLALALGVISFLPLLSPYKPYPNLVLVVLFALIVKLANDLKIAGRADTRWSIIRGLILGALIGASALLYSGWFLWSAAGIFLLIISIFPWKQGRAVIKKSLMFFASLFVGMLAISGFHIWAMIHGALFGKAVSDSYFYNDTFVDPGYFVMSLGDLAEVTSWPPQGELGGVGLFMIFLTAGLACSIAFKWHNNVVRTAVFLLFSALAARYFIATLMVYKNAVYLWPRTSAVILYCLLVATALSSQYFWNQFAAKSSVTHSTSTKAFGLLIGVSLLLSSGASSISSNYFPLDKNTVAKFAFYSQHMEPVHVDCFPLILLERCPPAK